MGRIIALAALALIGSRAEGRSGAPLYDPVMLNIGINCQWQQSCERRQLRAMASTHRLMATTRPPLWRVHLCNRNAARSPVRIDWVGFNNCIRNTSLRPTRHYRR